MEDSVTVAGRGRREGGGFVASVASYGYVRCSPILVTLMMEALSSSETSVLTRVTWRNIPEDAILHSHCSENLRFYLVIRTPPTLFLFIFAKVKFTEMYFI
jgi:hypothetical protein